MGRHEAPLPPGRRLLSVALGASTVIVLAIAIWQVGASGDEGPLRAAATGPAPSTGPTTPPDPPATETTLATTIAPTIPPTISTAATLAPTTAATLPETTTTTLAPLVLEPDGLEVVDFGAVPEETVAEVSARLGPASSDSGWVNARGGFGTCPGSVVRVVGWHSLRLYFSDGPTDFGADGRHFFHYSQSTADVETVLDLRTASDIGIGSTVAELEAAYPGEVVIESTVPFGATFYVSSDGPGLLSGILTESVARGQVTAIAGGFGCGA